jgi:copper chaperone CopZ
MSTTTFDVGMTCEGCANACKRILNKVEGGRLPSAAFILRLRWLACPSGVTEVVTDVDAKTVRVSTFSGSPPNCSLLCHTNRSS